MPKLSACAQRQVISGSLPQRRRSVSQLRNFLSPKHSVLGCRSEMIASIAMRLVGYMSVAIIH